MATATIREPKTFSDKEEAERLVTKARIRLVLNRNPQSVFFATLALRLKLVAVDDMHCHVGHMDTMATDGKTLYVNPAFAASITPEQLVGVVCHEVMHVALSHMTRRRNREPIRWNVSADLAANSILKESGYQLPAGGCFAGEGKFKKLPPGRSAEEYYSLLDDHMLPQQGPGAGGCGIVLDTPGAGGPGTQASQSEIEAMRADWEVAVAQAAQQAKQRGKLPAGLDRLVTDLLQPTVDWREVLREFVRKQAKNDYSWSRINRRMIGQGYYLPGMYSEELGEIVVAVDTSGSIGQKELNLFASEMSGIISSYSGVEMTILYHDSAVANVQKWTPMDGDLKLEPRGGGGTDHRPVFKWIEEHLESPTCLVCLTDCYSAFPKDAPSYPTLWCVANNAEPKVPWGQVLQIKE